MDARASVQTHWSSVPAGGGSATVIAWFWSRTVPSLNPAFSDVHVPIASSFLLSSKAGKEVWVDPIVDKTAKTITYTIRNEGTKTEIAKAKEGTKAGRGANFRCIISNTAITPDYVKRVGKAGDMGQALIAIAAIIIRLLQEMVLLKVAY